MVHLLDFPKETIVQIFNHYLATEGHKNFYLCISKVCKEWDSICKDSIFWRKFDGSLSQDYLLELCRNRCLAKTEELVYSLSKDIKPTKDIEEIFKSLPNLKSIDFSKVRLLNESTLALLAKHCKKVNAIKFSQDDYNTELKSMGYSSKKCEEMDFQKYSVSSKLLSDFLTVQGQNLTVIDISHSKISLFNKLIILIANSCNNLEKLFIENIKHSGKSAFPVDVIQKQCCKLKDLRLGFPVIFTQHQTNTLPGFLHLETFTHPNNEKCSFTDKDLKNVLFASHSLKTLDIRGCKSISVNAILSLPATHVEHLYLSGTNLHLTSKLSEILTKWIKSLRTLDISRASSDSINEVLSSLLLNGRMVNLESLNLSNTRINAETLHVIIENCEKLKSLNLTSCRSIGRGLNIEYLNREAIKKLHIDLLCQFGR